MGKAAAYDAHSDWYEHYVQHTAAGYFARVRATLRALLGPGDGPCLDVCCGTGAHARTVSEPGWTPVGVDLSTGQLRHATKRLRPTGVRARVGAWHLPLAALLNAFPAAGLRIGSGRRSRRR